MTRSTAAIALATLLAAWAVPVSAQRGGNTWKPLIPGLRTQFAAKSDPEMGTRLALVYAHEGMIYDAYRVLRQVDQAIGGAQGGSAADTNRAAFARRVSARASAEVGQDPGNLLARYELAFGSWFLETDHHSAMREMLEINHQDPRNAMNHGFLGYVYADRKDAPNTIAQWEEATRLDPSNSLLHYMLGWPTATSGGRAMLPCSSPRHTGTAPSTTTSPAVSSLRIGVLRPTGDAWR